MHLRKLPGPPVLIVALLWAVLAIAQQPGKRPLNHRDYDGWRSITNQSLSRDGKLLAYAVFPQEGDGQLIVRDLVTGQEKRASLGALPPPPDPTNVETPEEQPARTQGVRIVFTPGERFVVSTTFPLKADVDQAKKERRRPAQMPKGGLVILGAREESVTHIPDVKSMQVPENGDAFVVYLKESPQPGAAADAATTPKDELDQGRGAAASNAGTGAGARPQLGADLIVRDLHTPEPAERTFADVTEYALSKDGKTLVYTVASKTTDTNGAYAVAPLGSANPVALVKGKGRYAKPTFDRLQNQVAFLAARGPEHAAPALPSISLGSQAGCARRGNLHHHRRVS